MTPSSPTTSTRTPSTHLRIWDVTPKLVRHQKADPTDIVAMLCDGTKFSGVRWTPQNMEDWIMISRWSMGYNNYQPQRVDEVRDRDRIQDAVRLFQGSSDDGTSGKGYAPVRPRRPSVHMVHEHRIQSAHSHTPARVRPLPVSFDLAVSAVRHMS